MIEIYSVCNPNLTKAVQDQVWRNVVYLSVTFNYKINA